MKTTRQLKGWHIRDTIYGPVIYNGRKRIAGAYHSEVDAKYDLERFKAVLASKPIYVKATSH